MQIGLYQHHKGELYDLQFIALDCRSNEKMAVYMHLYSLKIWTRPLVEFEKKFKKVELREKA